jgi:hypothetical protein
LQTSKLTFLSIHQLFSLFLASSSLWLLVWAQSVIQKENDFFANLRAVNVEMENGSLDADQSHIEIAMAAFSIELPTFSRDPLFDPEILDRGVTVKSIFTYHSYVSIGEPSFSSWALLASTLAHEVEIHTRQNILSIALLDLLGFNGTALAERVAYQHEVNQAERFGLNISQTELISSTMDHFYPQGNPFWAKDTLSRPFKIWLAKSSLYHSNDR